MTTTRWIIFAVICVAIVGGLALYTTRDQTNVDGLDEYAIINEGPIADHTKGSGDVTIIEYGDFECPGCGKLYPDMKQIVEHYTDEVTLVYRNFPLTSIHPNALAAATAAEAAGLQGEFFAMHDMLFEQQDAWKEADSSERTDIFRNYAENIGLNGNQFQEDLANEDIADKIRRDQALGRKSGAESTPTVFIEGELVANDVWNDPQQLETAVRDAIEAAGVDDMPDRIYSEEE